MVSKTWYFGPSSVTLASIAKMQDEGYFRAGHAMPPPAGETVPNPPEGYAVVFKDFYWFSTPSPGDFPGAATSSDS
jgi:hypothetical protein